MNQEFAKVVLQQGGLQNLLWDRKSPELRWRVLADSSGFHTRSEPNQHVLYELVITPVPWQQSGFKVSRELLSECYFVGNEWEYVNIIERDENRVSTFDDAKKEPTVLSEQLPAEQTILSLSPFTTPSSWFFRSGIESWGIHHDMAVHQDAAIRQAAVARVESRIAADGQNLIPVLHTLYTGNRDFKKQVDEAMKAAFGEEYEEVVFPPAADQRINLRIRWKSLRTEQSAADLSDGTIRFLLLLTILANPTPGELIAIDEPEVGLHPGMFPIIAEFAATAAEKTKVILTTHSPQFLDAFGENIPTTTVARWVGGETQLVVLEGQKLARWLQEFSLGSLFKSGELEEMD